MPRPVDIDQAMTGFTKLRTLRIYQFDKGSVIHGHAEEDEVFIVVMAGSIELTMIVDPSKEFLGPVTLIAPTTSDSVACAAYLPPHAAYTLVAQSASDVAYARAQPASSPAPKIFSSLAQADTRDTAVLLEELAYAERLRFRLVHFKTQQSQVCLTPIHRSETMCEGLIHIRTAAPTRKAVATLARDSATPILLDSLDTVAAESGERLTLTIAEQLSGLILIVMAF